MFLKHEERVPHSTGHREASASISAALATVRFPATRTELVKKVGAWSVPVEGRATPLREILEKVPHDEFRDYVEAQNEIDHHWSEIAKALRPKPQ